MEKGYGELLRLLSNLAKSGCALPTDAAPETADIKEGMTYDAKSTIAEKIASAIAPAVGQLIAKYAGDNDAEINAVMLCDDLADIYYDLRNGLDLYARGESHLADAIWHWRVHYEFHWGPHLFRALKTVHAIRYGLYLE